MPNIPPDGWESAITEARDGIDTAHAEVATTRSEVVDIGAAVTELRDRIGAPGAGLPRQVQELHAAVAALTARVADLEGTTNGPR